MLLYLSVQHSNPLLMQSMREAACLFSLVIRCIIHLRNFAANPV